MGVYFTTISSESMSSSFIIFDMFCLVLWRLPPLLLPLYFLSIITCWFYMMTDLFGVSIIISFIFSSSGLSGTKGLLAFLSLILNSILPPKVSSFSSYSTFSLSFYSSSNFCFCNFYYLSSSSWSAFLCYSSSCFLRLSSFSILSFSSYNLFRSIAIYSSSFLFLSCSSSSFCYFSFSYSSRNFFSNSSFYFL